MISNNTLIIEISGVFGAGYHPSLLDSISSHLRLKYRRIDNTTNKEKKIVTRYYVDNTNLTKNNLLKRDRLTSLIVKNQNNSITNEEWIELISLMNWAEKLFHDQLNEYRQLIDIVFRRGGRLQDYVLFHKTRWKENDFERIKPKLQFFLKADLEIIEALYKDKYINNIITNNQEVYKQTPELAFEEQEDWLSKVKDLTGLKYIQRKHVDRNKYAIQIVEEIIPAMNVFDFKTTKNITIEKKVFLSHSHADKKIVNKLKIDLEDNGIKTWYDERDMNIGDIVNEKITEGINQSDCFLIVISPNSIKSDWVKYELNEAYHVYITEKKRILPVLIGDLSEKDIPQKLKKHLYSDLRNNDNYDQSIKKLCSSITAIS